MLFLSIITHKFTKINSKLIFSLIEYKIATLEHRLDIKHKNPYNYIGKAVENMKRLLSIILVALFIISMTACEKSEKKNAENKADDVITTYQFDDLGRTVSQQVKYGNGVEAGAGAYQYTSTDTDETVSDDKNKIRNQAGLGQNTVNLVKNSNVTGWSNWTKATSTGAAEESTYTTAASVLTIWQ